MLLAHILGFPVEEVLPQLAGGVAAGAVLMASVASRVHRHGDRRPRAVMPAAMRRDAATEKPHRNAERSG